MTINLTDAQLEAILDSLKSKVHIAKELGKREDYIKYSRIINHLKAINDA